MDLPSYCFAHVRNLTPCKWYSSERLGNQQVEELLPPRRHPPFRTTHAVGRHVQSSRRHHAVSLRRRSSSQIHRPFDSLIPRPSVPSHTYARTYVRTYARTTYTPHVLGRTVLKYVRTYVRKRRGSRGVRCLCPARLPPEIHHLRRLFRRSDCLIPRGLQLDLLLRHPVGPLPCTLELSFRAGFVQRRVSRGHGPRPRGLLKFPGRTPLTEATRAFLVQAGPWPGQVRTRFSMPLRAVARREVDERGPAGPAGMMCRTACPPPSLPF